MKRAHPGQLQIPFAFEPAPAETPARRSLVIEAGAGTGKTTSIVREVLSILMDEPDLPADRIVMITFTEKAAGEIADRIRQAITDLRRTIDGRAQWPADGEPIFSIPEDSRERSRRAIERHHAQLDRFTSQTIHSFCQRILRMHPLEANLHPQFSVIEGFERTRIYEQIYAEWLRAETAAGGDPAHIAEWDVALGHFGFLDAVRETLMSFVPKRDLLTDPRYSLGDVSEAEPELLKVLGAIRSAGAKEVAAVKDGAVRATIEYIREHLPPQAATLEEWLAWFAPIAESLRDANLPRGTFNVEFRFLRGETKQLTIVDRLESHRAAVAMRSLGSRFVAFLEAEKQRRGIVDFDDLLLRTAALLRDPAVLAQVRSRFRYIFVDEFQDTDRVQAEIVDQLSRDAAGELVPGRTVIVGDPKQSIYSFRRADPETYETTVERFVRDGAEERALVEQRRSDPPMVDALNAIFAEIFSAPSTPTVARPSYERLVARRSDTIRELDARVTLLRSLDVPGAKVDERQAIAIAEWIRARVAEGSPYRRFAVLLRKRTNVDRYLEAFEQYGIPYVTPPTRAFLEKRPAVDLVAVLRAIAWPFDTGALISAARSPYFALSDTEIARHFLAPGSDGGPMEGVRRRIRAYAEASRNMTVAALIETVIRDAAIEALYQHTPDPDRAALWLDGMRDIAHEFDLRHGGSVAQFVEEIARRRDQAEDAEPSWIDETQDAVAIMTVHASKGLEFETVILPDLGSGMRADRVRMFAVEDPPTLLFTGALANLGGEFRRADDAPLSAVGRARMDAETDRLFYVAVTRAKSDVVFVVDEKDSLQGFWTCLGRVLGREPKTIGDCFPQEPGRSVVDTSVVFKSVLRVAWERLPPPVEVEGELPAAPPAAGPFAAEETLPPPLPFVRPRRDEEQTEEPAAPPQRAGIPWSVARSARAAGIAMHRVLEVWDGTEAALDGLIASVVSEQRLDADMARKITSRLRTVLRSPVHRRIAAAQSVGRELPIFYTEPGGRIVEGRIDRLVREGSSHLVIDYKSGAPDPERLVKDREQVERYCAAVRAITGGACAGILWYIGAEKDEIVEVT